ncbi:MAG: DUF423 domain-containing protein [Desulfobacterales bacterium]|nr:DUF423 domain-containing protein [Desulfobacterales bacterium]MDJ0875521.1 DUF423 domain-containing protein [Desulfobacterales bacterium]
MSRLLIFCGALCAALSVILGAFGAHGLKSRLPPEILATFETGVQYQFYHALGLILIGIVVQFTKASAMVTAAGWLMLAGIVLFSGSLYAICFSGIRSLGMITPVGGMAFIVAWVLLAIGILRS